MERFTNSLLNRVVTLDNAADVVTFNYSSQSSIASLNLILRKNSNTENSSRPYFVSTEEKCRKIFAQSRILLYHLHLDLPECREYQLENSEITTWMTPDENVPHIGKIVTSWGFYMSLMSELVEEALQVTDQKSKILGFLLKKSLVEDGILYGLEPRITKQFMNCFETNSTDSILSQPLYINFEVLELMAQLEQPKMLESLLRHACHHSIDFECPYQELIKVCFLSDRLFNIEPILKLKDAPEFSEILHKFYMIEISVLREDLTEEVCEAAANFVTEKRFSLMLQILWMFLHSTRRHSTATATLRLIWRSIPDAYITLAEFKKVFDKALVYRELRRMNNFYCRSIGESHSIIEPRSLKHLCRIKVREILCKKKVWIPDGVRQIGLPQSLQRYLTLLVPYEDNRRSNNRRQHQQSSFNTKRIKH